MKAIRLEGDKRACVAMLLRPVGLRGAASPAPPDRGGARGADAIEAEHEPVTMVAPSQGAASEEQPGIGSLPKDEYDIFFIIRAQNAHDRWSGQVGFPGGRQERGESDEQTAAREVYEEVGLVLPDLPLKGKGPPSFRRIGRVHDRMIIQGTTKLVVACIVYVQTAVQAPLCLAEKEVAACGWVPLASLLKEDCASNMNLSIAKSMFGLGYPRLARMSTILGVRKLVFTKVELRPVANWMFIPHPTLGAKEPTGHDMNSAMTRFFVWGLTLSMVNDAFFDMLKWRQTRISLPPVKVWGGVFAADRIFDSDLHNVGLHVFRQVYAMTSSAELSYMAAVQYYLLGIIAASAVAGVGVPSAWLVQRLRSSL